MNNKTKRPLVAALYARVSTGRQEQEATINSQTDEIKKRIITDGNTLSADNIFIDDGWTGEMFKRPALDLMRDSAQQGKFQILYVYDRGRIARKFAYQEIVIEELTDKDIEFVTLHDIKAITPEEHVLQAMQGVFHEYERIKIAERMRRGKMYKAKAGILINGSAVYGYNYVKKTETVPAHYEINEDETRVVRMIFKWVGEEGISLRGVIKRLYDLKILPRKKKSDFWTKGPIVRMLKSEAYSKGVIYFNKSEAVVAKHPLKETKYKKIKRTSRKMKPKDEWVAYKIPNIIPDNGLFEKIQSILENNQKYSRRNRKYDYLLTGKTWCQCGNRRVGDGYSKGGNHYYRCAERIYKFPVEKKCQAQGINAIALDGALWNELKNFLMDPKRIQEQAEEWIKSQMINNLNQQEIKTLESSIEKIKKEEENYARTYAQGLLEFGQLKNLITDAKRRKVSYEKQVEELKKESRQASFNGFTLDELVEEAKNVIKTLNFDNKYGVVQDIIDKVIVKADRIVEVIGHFPAPAVNMSYETINRDSRITQCRKINPFQCPP